MNGIHKRVLIIIEFTIGLLSIAYALAVGAAQVSASVTYNSTITEALTSSPAILAYTIVTVVSGIIIVTGIITRRDSLVSTGLFIGICVKLFQLIVIWLYNGFLTPSWINTAIVMFICIVLWLGRQAEKS